MRSPLIPLVAVAFIVACADGVTTPLQPGEPNFYDNPPPPWAEVYGDVTTAGTSLSIAPLMSRSAPGSPSATHVGGPIATYKGWLLVSPGGQASILRFADGGTNVTFSKGARIMKMNGKVSGVGTMTVGGHPYDLSLVDEFDANGACATAAFDYDGPSCASFSAEDGSFSSQGSVWTGVLSNDVDQSDTRRGCTTNADFVVTNETELSAALAAASAGGTIAIDGLIEVSSGAVIQADDIRLTCATPGSGLINSSGSALGAVLQVLGAGVQVDNLFLSGVPSAGVGGATHPVFAYSAERLRLIFNEIRCADGGTCAFLVSSPGALVSDNSVQSLGTSSGIHVQGGATPTDYTIVERNDIVASTVSGSPLFGAIRVRDGTHLVVRNNSTSGPWRNGIALAELNGAIIENNSIHDAQDRGIIGSTNSPSPVSIRNSIIRANTIDGPQAIGINLTRACWNRVELNDISAASGTLRAKFEMNTGANVYIGNAALVVDEGNFDCDGDGDADPNTIMGSSTVSLSPANASASRASAAQNAVGPVASQRSAWQSNGAAFPELQ